MFNRQEDSTNHDSGNAPSSKASRVNTPSGGQSESSVISAGLKIVGNLQSEADVVISGTVEGDINSRGLTVSEGAHITGTIESTSVEVRGKVDGQIHASSVKIARSGYVNGDVIYETLCIDEGAVVEGQLRRNKDSLCGHKSKISTLTPVDGEVKKKEASGEVKAG